MTVVRTNPGDITSDKSRTTVTVWNRSEQKLIEVPHGELEPVPLLESLAANYEPKQTVVKYLIELLIQTPAQVPDLTKA